MALRGHMNYCINATHTPTQVPRYDTTMQSDSDSSLLFNPHSINAMLWLTITKTITKREQIN